MMDHALQVNQTDGPETIVFLCGVARCHCIMAKAMFFLRKNEMTNEFMIVV